MNSSPEQRSAGPGKAGIFLAFIPWVLFGVLVDHDTLLVASAVALAAAILLGWRSIVAGYPKFLEVGTIVAFVLFTLAALIGGSELDDDLARYGRSIAAAVLASIAFASVAFDHPFTEQYAKESVDPSLWGTDRFKSVNRRLSLLWATVFALLVPFHIAAGVIDTQRAITICNWIVPILLIVFAVRQTETIRVRAQAGSEAPPADG